MLKQFSCGNNASGLASFSKLTARRWPNRCGNCIVLVVATTEVAKNKVSCLLSLFISKLNKCGS